MIINPDKIKGMATIELCALQSLYLAQVRAFNKKEDKEILEKITNELKERIIKASVP